MKILSIDAWADCSGCEHESDDWKCWTWNNWHTIGHVNDIPVDVIGYMIDEGYLKESARDLVEVNDDQYNIVVLDKKNGMPLYAIEYGNNG